MSPHKPPSHGNAVADEDVETDAPSVLPPMRPPKKTTRNKSPKSPKRTTHSSKKKKKKPRKRSTTKFRGSVQNESHRDSRRQQQESGQSSIVGLIDDIDDDDSMTQPGAIAVPGSSSNLGSNSRLRNDENQTQTTRETANNETTTTASDPPVLQASLVPDTEDIEAQIEQRIHQQADQIRQELWNQAVVADVVDPNDRDRDDEPVLPDKNTDKNKASTPAPSSHSRHYRTLACLTVLVSIMGVTGIVVAVYFSVKPKEAVPVSTRESIPPMENTTASPDPTFGPTDPPTTSTPPPTTKAPMTTLPPIQTTDPPATPPPTEEIPPTQTTDPPATPPPKEEAPPETYPPTTPPPTEEVPPATTPPTEEVPPETDPPATTPPKEEDDAFIAVGGVLSVDTVWDDTSKPYYVSSTIQIPLEVTLTIEPGVEIFATEDMLEYSNMFLVHGTVMASGALLDGHDKVHFFAADNAPESAFVSVENCQIQNGQAFWPATGNNQPAYFHLKDSTLTNLRWYSYISYPTNDVYIDRNSLVTSCGFSVGHLDTQVYIRWNRFESRHPDCPDYMDSWVTSWNAPSSSSTLVRYNSFLDVGEMAVVLEPGHDGSALDARENYWGTLDEDVIQSMIWDKNDDVTTSGTIPYTPYLTESHPDVPGASNIPPPPPRPPSPPPTPPPTPEPPPPPNPTTPPGPVETWVGGILSTDTTWTASKSPYRLLDTVQIPEAVTLTIESGAQVVGDEIPEYGDMFLVHGSLVARGATFDGQNRANFFSAAKAPESAFVDVQSCVVENGRSFWPATGNSQPASFRLYDSSLINLQDYSYIWYPVNDVWIVGNEFVNSCGFSVGHTNAQVYVESNRFEGRHVSCPDYMDAWVSSWNAPSGGATIVKQNSFLNVGETAVMLEPGHDGGAIDARDNFWGTTNPTIIDDMIYDQNDDLTVAGVIPYEPILTDDPNGLIL